MYRYVLTEYLRISIFFTLSHPAVSISLEQSVYSVAEADGFVEVCAVLQGQLARDVNVELRTEGDTASEFIDVCMKFTYP